MNQNGGRLSFAEAKKRAIGESPETSQAADFAAGLVWLFLRAWIVMMAWGTLHLAYGWPPFTIAFWHALIGMYAVRVTVVPYRMKVYV